MANPLLSQWVGFGRSGHVEVRVGKVELGQGIVTALGQIAAEELDVAWSRVHVVPASTDGSPDEGFTAGSRSVMDSGSALRTVCAELRRLLVAAASARSGLAPESLDVHDGEVVDGSGRRHGSYWSLLRREDLAVAVTGTAPPKDPARHELVGHSVPRPDLEWKLTGDPAFVHDLRLPGQLFGRMVRPPSPGACLLGVDDTAARALPRCAAWSGTAASSASWPTGRRRRSAPRSCCAPEPGGGSRRRCPWRRSRSSGWSGSRPRPARSRGGRTRLRRPAWWRCTGRRTAGPTRPRLARPRRRRRPVDGRRRLGVDPQPGHPSPETCAGRRPRPGPGAHRRPPRGGGRLLRAQQCGRRGVRRGAAGPRRARPTGPGRVVARGRVRLGALQPGHGGGGRRGRRCLREPGHLGAARVEQRARQPPGVLRTAGAAGGLARRRRLPPAAADPPAAIGGGPSATRSRPTPSRTWTCRRTASWRHRCARPRCVGSAPR